MNSVAAVLRVIDDAFDAIPRPAHFTNFAHCEECLEHDTTLRSCPRDQLTLEQLGRPESDPVTFCTPAAQAYLLPRLVRVALDVSDDGQGGYFTQLLNHLYSGYTYNSLHQFCRRDQRSAVHQLLLHVLEEHAGQVDEWRCADELLSSLALWSDDHAAIAPEQHTAIR